MLIFNLNIDAIPTRRIQSYSILMQSSIPRSSTHLSDTEVVQDRGPKGHVGITS